MTSPHWEPIAAFKQAEAFRLAALALNRMHKTGFAVVYCACDAFALELYLKCLLMAGGHAGSGHDLWKLFFRLPANDQMAIRRHFGDSIFPQVVEVVNRVEMGELPRSSLDTFDFEVCLRRSATAFHKFRYFHEGLMEDGDGWTAGGIVNATRRRILDLYPDWANLPIDLPPGLHPPDTSPFQ